MKLIDTHCHLDNEKYDIDRKEIIEKISKTMEFVVNIGYDFESSKRSIELAQKNSNIYATVGVHPTEIGDNFSNENYMELKEMLLNEKVVALGEIGLDYHWMTKTKEIQKDWFRKQMELARELKKPVVIHTREAIKDTIDILKEFKDIYGVIHCYPGSYESATEIIDNYYFGVGGVSTFKNSKTTVEFIRQIPLERIVIETDSPYLTPEPFRGKRNLPEYVEYVVEKIASIKEIDVETVIAITNENAKKLYKIGKK